MSDRLAAIDRRLTVLTWMISINLVLTLISQAALWQQIGKLDGQLNQIGAQIPHIEVLLQQQR